MEIQEDLESENILSDSKKLKDFNTKRIKTYERGILVASNEAWDESHLGFLQENNELEFDDILIVKKVFDYLKNN